MFQYSELDMANAFSLALKNNTIGRLPIFDFAYREVVCQQGIADFIGITSKGFLSKYKFDKLTSVETCSQILSLLKLHSGRKIDYLCLQTGLSPNIVMKLLREMGKSNFIRKERNLYYRCIPDISAQSNAWAFELKLSNWKRAIFQALQYKAFSNYAIVVFPFEKKQILQNNINYFKKLNVGVLLFDMVESKYKWIFYPKKEHPISKWHSFLLIGKILSLPEDNNIVLDH